MKPTVATLAEAAGPTPEATKKPTTLRRLSSRKFSPKWRWISHATNKRAPALHRANTVAAAGLRSPERLATILAVTTARVTGTRTLGPNAMSVPAEMPAAGQNTATPSGFVSRTKLI